MNNYIDAHTHIHMTAGESRAFLQRLNFPVHFEGTTAESLSIMDKAGIRTTMIVPWIPARQFLEERMSEASKRGRTDRDALLQQLGSEWSAYNRWAAQTARESAGRFTSVVAVDPVLFGADWTRREIDAHLKEGAIGLKITPLFIGAYPADERMSVLWEEANRRALAVLTLSTGPMPAQALAALSLPSTYGDVNHPQSFEPILKAYPRCKIVLAHIGAGAEEEVARLTARYPNLYCDTSQWLDHVGKSGGPTAVEAADLFKRIGTDRILFGTNYPIMDPAHFISVLKQIPITETEQHQILSENFERAYGSIT